MRRLSRRVLANRRNAQKSTGPVTPPGKARAAQNARRHGLSLPAALDPRYRDEIQLLALHLASANPSPREWDHALRAAEARLDLLRARRARDELISRTGANCECRASASPLDVRQQIELIYPLERYERSATARFRRASWALLRAQEQWS